MKHLTVQTATHPYNIYIGENIRYQLKRFLKEDYSSILIVTDDVIAPLYLDDIKGALGGETVFEAIIPSGEASKNIHTYYDLQTVALRNNLDRKSLIVALGGGVIGDLAGFVAATFMRGIDYIQVPTTILAHDSSVGGKVAINHELGKNMIGNFYPPKAVVYDVGTLKTLPEHEVRSGYAELVKEAFIADEEFLNNLFQTNIHQVSDENLIDHLYKGIQIKADIVERDEKEANIRKFLNFGHTFAHALETEIGYGVITHGEAVAIGMLFALRVSEQKFNVSFPYEQLYGWLENNGYPLSLNEININRIIEHMKRDKKSMSKQVQMVLLQKIGEPTVNNLNDQELYQLLEMFLKELNERDTGHSRGNDGE